MNFLMNNPSNGDCVSDFRLACHKAMHKYKSFFIGVLVFGF